MAGRFSFKYRKDWSVSRVITKVVVGLLSLYVGGTIVTEVGKVMNQTSSPLYKGLTLIGWTVGEKALSDGKYLVCGASANSNNHTIQDVTCISDVTGSGILAVIGIITIASIVLEFVEIRMK